jgi:hypothetical protein
MTWDDVYLDGYLDPLHEDFCEETQEVVKLRHFIHSREATLQSEDKREREIDEYYLKLYRGEIKRIQ